MEISVKFRYSWLVGWSCGIILLHDMIPRVMLHPKCCWCRPVLAFVDKRCSESSRGTAPRPQHYNAADYRKPIAACVCAGQAAAAAAADSFCCKWMAAVGDETQYQQQPRYTITHREFRAGRPCLSSDARGQHLSAYLSSNTFPGSKSDGRLPFRPTLGSQCSHNGW